MCVRRCAARLHTSLYLLFFFTWYAAVAVPHQKGGGGGGWGRAVSAAATVAGPSDWEGRGRGWLGGGVLAACTGAAPVAMTSAAARAKTVADRVSMAVGCAQGWCAGRRRPGGCWAGRGAGALGEDGNRRRGRQASPPLFFLFSSPLCVSRAETRERPSTPPHRPGENVHRDSVRLRVPGWSGMRVSDRAGAQRTEGVGEGEHRFFFSRRAPAGSGVGGEKAGRGADLGAGPGHLPRPPPPGLFDQATKARPGCELAAGRLSPGRRRPCMRPSPPGNNLAARVRFSLSRAHSSCPALPPHTHAQPAPLPLHGSLPQDPHGRPVCGGPVGGARPERR